MVMTKKRGKPFYRDCFLHAMRNYIRDDSACTSEAKELDRNACKEALRILNETERLIIFSVFSYKALTLQEAVSAASMEYGAGPDAIWITIKKVEHEFAKRRILI